MAEPVLILGASGRAAAFSALRAGLVPFVVDLFADEDLRAIAEVRQIPGRDYPDGFVDLARRFPPMPWMYTGGLENRPDIVGAIAAKRRLLGNGPEVLARVRDPFALVAALNRVGLPHPRVRRAGDRPSSGKWLAKPLDGCGGAGIRYASASRRRCGVYFQEFIDGESRSAVFRDEELLGVTRQLVGEPWLHARRFSYCGSVGPLALSDSEAAAWRTLGQFLVQSAGLRGVFGIDAIVRDGVPWPVEVNPRYTASVEVIEIATGIRALSSSQSPPRARSRFFGAYAKAVYYASQTITIPHNSPWKSPQRELNDGERPEFADIPRAGVTVRRSRPVLTIFGPDEPALRVKAAMLDAVFSAGARP